MNWFSWLWSWFTGPASPVDHKFVTKVQATTVQLCGFLPAASTIANIIAAATGQSAVVASATAMAGVICKAVNTPKAYGLVDEGTGNPVVNIDGTPVLIEGEFVK